MCFNVESDPKLDALIAGRDAMGARRRFHCGSNRIDARNPVPKISTAAFDNKFRGRHPDLACPGRLCEGARPAPQSGTVGVDMHIGSQKITDLTPFDDARRAAGGTRPRSDGERARPASYRFWWRASASPYRESGTRRRRSQSVSRR